MRSTLRVRRAESLPTTALSWLVLRDHFIATLGERAGEGSTLGPLVVLADAVMAPNSRFGIHPHRDMEILTVVVDGTLSHHGDQAHGEVLGAGDVQLISARGGIWHAEGNDTAEPLRLLQIWLRPDIHGGEPQYSRRKIDNQVWSQLAGDQEMPLRCDASVWWLSLPEGGSTRRVIPGGRSGYLLVVRGSMTVGEETLTTGDGASIAAGQVDFLARAPSVALWVETPAEEPSLAGRGRN